MAVLRAGHAERPATDERGRRRRNLKMANGPMQVWPHWPAPPAVEVLVLQAYLAAGDWLVQLSPLALPT